MTPGQGQKLVGHPGVVRFLELQVGQRIGLMGIEPGGNQHQLRLEGIHRRQNAIGHRRSKLG